MYSTIVVMENTDAALCPEISENLSTGPGGEGGGGARVLGYHCRYCWYNEISNIVACGKTNAKSQGEINQDVFVEWLLTGRRSVKLRQPEVHVLLVGRYRQYLIETLHQFVEHGSLVWMVTPAVPHYHISVEDTSDKWINTDIYS